MPKFVSFTLSTMKKFIALLMGSVAVTLAWGQTIEAFDPGLGFTLEYAASNAHPSFEAGQDTVWDASNVGVAQIATIELLPADSTPYASQFPLATHAQSVAGAAASYAYLGYGDNMMTYHGSHTNGFTVGYEDPLNFLPFPFSDGELHADVKTNVFNIAGLNYYRTDSISFQANGYGSLMHPQGGMFDDVLRTEMVRLVTDSSVQDQSSLLVEGLAFWQQDWPLPVAQVYRYHQIAQGDTTLLFQGSEYLVYATANVKPLYAVSVAPEVVLFPNPASTQVTLRGPEGQIVQVWNARGQLVWEGRQQAGDVVLDVVTWPVGMYRVRLGNRMLSFLVAR